MFNNFDNDKDYYLNPRIKRTDLEETYSEEQLLEYVKCSEDPKYFIENYVEINTLDHGFVKFKLRGYQEELIDCFNDNSKSIILSSRQSGKCFFINTIVTVRNKNTNEIEQITIGELYERTKTKKGL